MMRDLKMKDIKLNKIFMIKKYNQEIEKCIFVKIDNKYYFFWEISDYWIQERMNENDDPTFTKREFLEIVKLLGYKFYE